MPITENDLIKLGFEYNPLESNWNRKEFVIVNMGELSYTVCAKDLEKAIQNAQNAHSGF